MNFDLFVLPFTLGIIFIVVILAWRYFKWLEEFEIFDRKKFIMGVLSIRFFQAINEAFSEGLLHRKIFRVNFFLGLMHMSLAFFWFLMIVVGSAESKIYAKYPFNAPYDPVFFRFFNKTIVGFGAHAYFTFFMDLFLLIILIAVGLAVFKKIYSKFFGLTKTTKHRLVDRIAIVCLWLIFPLRYLAESSTAGICGNGSFLTNTTGNFITSFLPVGYIEYPLWWIYSSILGAFFVVMPFSRYMHIPTEMVLIFLRRFGIKNSDKIEGFANFEIQACSSCGICIDNCQMANDANMHGQQAVYYLRKLRFKQNFEDTVFNCLMCMRCNHYCPVGIDVAHLRNINRKTLMPKLETDTSFLEPELNTNPTETNIMYYAGCMSHLRPGIKSSIEKIFKNCNVSYSFIDKDSSVCCGRPMMVTGDKTAALEMLQKNKELINSFNSELLVVSCPICYKMFKEEYNLDVQVIHHTEFLKMLIDSNKITFEKSDEKYIYHDPCELGRGMNIYQPPRFVLNKIGKNIKNKYRKEKGLCCGGSLSNIRIRSDQREKITQAAYNFLTERNPDLLITACPRCEQVFSKVSEIPVKDIAELVAEKMIV